MIWGPVAYLAPKLGRGCGTPPLHPLHYYRLIDMSDKSDKSCDTEFALAISGAVNRKSFLRRI